MALDTDRGSAPPLLRVTGPADLARAIPYLLGFHPFLSLVVVGLRAKRVAVTARIDLDDLLDTPVLGETLAAFVRSGAEKVVAVVFDDSVSPRDDDGTLAWRELADEVHGTAARRGLDVDEVALVCRGRLWSYDCDNPQCCPHEGRPLANDSSQIAATAAYAGLVALPGRADLVAQLARRVDPAELPGLRDALRRREGQTRELDAAKREARDRADAHALIDAARSFDEAGNDSELADAQRLDFAVALRRIPVRDAVWMALDTGHVDGRDLWRRLATSLPAPYDAAPLFLFGWASYRDGNGALARIAADRALDSDPYYTAADLILAALSQALDPHQLPRFTREMVAEVIDATEVAEVAEVTEVSEVPEVTEAQRVARPAGEARRRR
jgi:hypothetical protein